MAPSHRARHNWPAAGSGGLPCQAHSAAGATEDAATAQLSRVTWDFGDGAVVTCAGPGTPYDSSYEADGQARRSPDCGHTYQRSSARQPGEAYPVSVSAQWAVSWAGGGQTGAAPAPAPAPAQAQTVTTALRVGELQAVNY